VPLPLPPGLKPLLAAGAALVPETEAALGNPSFEEAEARILVVRLSPWRDVDRSTSHLILFAECRKALSRAYLDFAFMPDRGDRELLVGAARGGGTPPWFYGLASGRSPADFDLVLVSNAFALELLNLPYLFSTSGLPLRASARAALGARRPLVVLGGSNAAAAGAIVGEAAADGSRDAMADGLFFGEGEGAIGELALALTAPGVSPDGRLARAEAVEGFWRAGVPPRGGGTRRRLLGASPEPLLEWPLLNSPESGTARLQIAAGCPGLCSFCFEGWDRRPYRERPLAHIIADAREIRRRQGADSLEVYSFNFNTHERIASLIFELGRIFRRVNLMSQRLDILAEVPGLLEAELAGDKRSFTLGVEGISRRMRAYYRKGIGDDDKAIADTKFFIDNFGKKNKKDAADAFFSEVRDARARGDNDKVVRVVHTMKPQLVAIDAPYFQDLCGRITGAVPGADPVRWAEDLDRFEQGMARVLGRA